MTDVIDIADVEFSTLSIIDSLGKIFFWRGRLFRGIRRESVQHVRKLFDCGLIAELIDAGLFPKSRITNFQMEGFGLVIEHELISPVTYSYEWSFLMLRNAACLVLRVNKIANKHGYQIQDCHGFNVVFDGTAPKFVDLGSFTACGDIAGAWLAYDEFLRFYYYPLQIWGASDGYIARRMLLGSSLLPHASYLIWRYSILRFLSRKYLFLIVEGYYGFRRLSRFSPEEIRMRVSGILGNMLAGARRHRLLPFQSVDVDSLLRRINKICRKRMPTSWADYHDTHRLDNDYIPTPRFERILAILDKCEIRTVIDLAGNQGALSRLLTMRNKKIRVACIDSDENAIDSLYEYTRDENIALTPVLADFVYPLATSHTPPPYERYYGDAVLALAVTHHLLLSGKLPIDKIFHTIGKYSRRYVFIEFMPLGLYDGKKAIPLPSWYTLDWFRDNFRKHFRLHLEENLEDNRVLFFGELTQSVAASNHNVSLESHGVSISSPNRLE